MKYALRKLRTSAQRYPYLTIAIVVSLVMVGSSLAIAGNVKRASSSGFDTSKVLPRPVSQPTTASNVFTADTIKQYDGKDGRKCYVAVKGVVYEIAGKGQWQEGQHMPSNGEAYCGADLTEAIKHSPHGESKLLELPKVGTYK